MRGEDVFQQRAGMKMREALSGIQNARGAREMALLAHRIAARRWELRGIDDRAGHGPPQMGGRIAMASVAGDCRVRECRRFVTVQRIRNGTWLAAVSPQALQPDAWAVSRSGVLFV